MRLSDAIALGRVLIEKPDPLTYCGCAIGMGLAAKGHTYHMNMAGKSYDALNQAVQEWPWLNSWRTVGLEDRGFRAISSWFHAVCDGRMTLDELIDKVRAIEPPEPDELSTQPSTPAQRQVAGVLG